MSLAERTCIAHLSPWLDIWQGKTWGKTRNHLIWTCQMTHSLNYLVIMQWFYMLKILAGTFPWITGVMTKELDNTQGRVCICEQAWFCHVLDINSKGSMVESSNWMRYQSPMLGSSQTNRWMKSYPVLSLAFSRVHRREVRYTEHAEAYHACS